MDKVENWLKQAEEDLFWARASLKEEILRGACFAAQQSAEKALKAFLISKGVRVAKIHDLLTLNAKCLEIDSEFRDLEESCKILSPFYLSSRYPDVAVFEEYSKGKAAKAVEDAEQIVNFIKTRI